MSKIYMIETNFMYGPGQLVLNSRKTSYRGPKKGFEDNQIVEEYEGECEECEREVQKKVCPICNSQNLIYYKNEER